MYTTCWFDLIFIECHFKSSKYFTSSKTGKNDMNKNACMVPGYRAAIECTQQIRSLRRIQTNSD